VHASANSAISVDIRRQAISCRFRALQVLQKCQQIRCFLRRRGRPFPFDKNEKCPENAAIPRFLTNRFPQSVHVEGHDASLWFSLEMRVPTVVAPGL
jgi:hypothetical protein